MRQRVISHEQHPSVPSSKIESIVESEVRGDCSRWQMVHGGDCRSLRQERQAALSALICRPVTAYFTSTSTSPAHRQVDKHHCTATQPPHLIRHRSNTGKMVRPVPLHSEWRAECTAGHTTCSNANIGILQSPQPAMATSPAQPSVRERKRQC